MVGPRVDVKRDICNRRRAVAGALQFLDQAPHPRRQASRRLEHLHQLNTVGLIARLVIHHEDPRPLPRDAKDQGGRIHDTQAVLLHSDHRHRIARLEIRSSHRMADRPLEAAPDDIHGTDIKTPLKKVAWIETKDDLVRTAEAAFLVLLFAEAHILKDNPLERINAHGLALQPETGRMRFRQAVQHPLRWNADDPEIEEEAAEDQQDRPKLVQGIVETAEAEDAPQEAAALARGLTGLLLACWAVRFQVLYCPVFPEVYTEVARRCRGSTFRP